MTAPLTICLTADCCNGPFPEHDSLARWDQIWLAAARLRTLVAEATAGSARWTWFVRADNQIAATLGHACAHFERYLPQLMGWHQAGDALGLHPHCYQLAAGAWVPETDPLREAAMVLSLRECLAGCPLPVRVSRVGEVHMTELLLAALQDLGLRADATALPGRRRDTPPIYDWSAAPTVPWRPNPAVDFWELPFSMLPLTGPDETVAKSRYLNLSFKSELLQPALDSWLAHQSRLICIAHPVEVIPVDPATRAQFPLLSFELETVRANLRYIIDWAAQAGRPVRFLNLEESVTELAAEP